MEMGVTYADLTLANVFTRKTVAVRALVDTGTSRLIVTPEIAAALGYDPQELAVKYVNLADGRRLEAPHIEGVRIQFQDRRCTMDAVVLPGDECLLGFIPLEDMDLVVDPLNERLVGAGPKSTRAAFTRGSG
jgi:clan AA aspartic protease